MTVTLRPLRPHQVTGMDMLYASIASGHRTPMLAAPTGAGKTRIIAEIVIRALGKGKRILIIVPALSLIDQTVAALEQEGITDIGVIQGLHERTNSAAAVQVASVQTLQRRKMPAADMILVDEAHVWNKFYVGMIADAKAAGVPVIGLSATPWSKNLGKHYDDLLTVTSIEALIAAGYLSKFRVFAPSHPDLSQVRSAGGDYLEGDLAEAMNKVELVADVVTTWLRKAERRPTLCFAVDRAHAKELQQQFEAAGVRTGYVDSYVKREERAKIRHGFHTGEIEVVCNVGCLTTGVDWDVRCLILARPTKSEILFTQIVGRGLRTADGKDDLLILDHSDSHLRLGFVTDIRHDELDTGKRRESKSRPSPKPKECSRCHFLRPPKVHRCSACGFAPSPQVCVEVEQGDLVEMRASKKAKEDRDRRAHVFGQLQTIGAQRGYSKGWASHKYKDRFGAWPNDVIWAPRVEPEPDVLSWVRSRDIAFAKGKGRSRVA